jgi:hypothetical protein
MQTTFETAIALQIVESAGLTAVVRASPIGHDRLVIYDKRGQRSGSLPVTNSRVFRKSLNDIINHAKRVE